MLFGFLCSFETTAENFNEDFKKPGFENFENYVNFYCFFH